MPFDTTLFHHVGEPRDRGLLFDDEMHETVVVGTPDVVTLQVGRLRDELGCGRLALFLDTPRPSFPEHFTLAEPMLPTRSARLGWIPAPSESGDGNPRETTTSGKCRGSGKCSRLSFAQVKRSLRLFAEEVMPRFSESDAASGSSPPPEPVEQDA